MPKKGKKNKKNAEKIKKRKELLKQQVALEQQAKLVLKKANDTKDLFEKLAPFRNYKRKGLDVTFKYMSSTDAPKDVLDWAFQLTKTNMEELYNTCRDWGWQDKVKHRELIDDATRLIVAFDNTTNKPVGLAHIRFIMEEDVYLTYVWELQLEEVVRRKGLGKFMMQIIELFSWKSGLQKVILTVFKENKASMNFYRKKLGYQMDDTDPSLCGAEEDVGYEILSKVNPKLLKEAQALAKQEVAQIKAKAKTDNVDIEEKK